MPRILIVDDDLDIRAMLARALAPLGTVEQAAGGRSALARIATEPYDLVLLDLHMPDVDGFGVLQSEELRNGPNASTPIYLVTADVSDEARTQALRRRGVFLLTKPVNLAALRSFVRSTLDQRAARTRGRRP